MRTRGSDDATLRQGEYVFCAAIVIVLFSAISIPPTSDIYPTVNRVLSELPGVSVVDHVGTFALTQVRYSSLNVAIPLGFLLLLGVLAGNGRSILRMHFGRVAAGFIFFASFAAMSALVFHEYMEAMKLALYLIVPVGFFSFAPEEQGRIRRALLGTCLVMGSLNAMVTIWQYGVMSGWAFDTDSLRLHRPDGLFGDSIISAVFSVVAIAVTAFAGMKVSNVIKGMIVLACLAAGVVTGARTFYYLLPIVALLLLFSRSRQMPVRWKVALTLAAALLAASLMSPMGQGLVDALSLEESSESRDLKRQLAIELFWDSPVVGVGTGQYAVAESAVVGGQSLGLHGTNPHNVYLQVLSENGLLGFVPLFFSVLCILDRSLRQWNSIALLLLLCVYLAVAWSLGILYSAAFTTFFVALGSALLSSEATG